MQHNGIETYLKQLNLQGMLATFKEGPMQPPMTSERWEAFLEELLEAEFAHRKARSYAYRLKLAKLGQIKTFDNFDSEYSDVPHEKLERVKRCEFIDAHENVLLIGGSGTGKTHISLALAHKVLQENYRVKFYKFNQLARELLSAQEHRYESRFMEKLMRFDLLIIDELGYLPIEHKAGALLFELLSGFYEKGPMIITTHLVFSEWSTVFGGDKLATALIDRITHHCHVLETGDKSWRIKEAKNKQ